MALLTVTQNTVFKRTATQSASLPSGDNVSVNAGRSLEVDYAFRVGSHCFVKLKQGLGTVGTIGYFFQPHVSVQLDELRGVWLTNVDSDVLGSRRTIQQGLQHLRAIGFNTIYPVVWQRGFTLYPSPVADRWIGTPVMPDPRFMNRDMLAEVIEEAKSLNMRVIPWFEYGLATLPNSTLATKYPDWITVDRNGQKIRIKATDRKPDHFVWLNPCHVNVQRFLVDLIVDVVHRYDVDGIQLDDHFSFPIELGYDLHSQRDYQNEHQGKNVPENHTDPEKVKWATRKMTTLLMQIVHAVKTTRSDSLISISPNPLGFSKTNYAIDWWAWIQQNLVDELVLQVYREQLSSFVNEIDKQEVNDSSNQIPTAIGILTGLKVKPISTRSITQQIEAVRRRNVAGVSCFFYETLFNEALFPTRVPRNLTELRQVFT